MLAWFKVILKRKKHVFHVEEARSNAFTRVVLPVEGAEIPSWNASSG